MTEKIEQTIKFAVPSSKSGKARRFIKESYIGKRFKVNANDRTKIVRLFIKALKPIDQYDYQTAKAVRHFLKRFGLSEAETLTILTNKGFKYSDPRSLRNLKVAGAY